MLQPNTNSYTCLRDHLGNIYQDGTVIDLKSMRPIHISRTRRFLSSLGLPGLDIPELHERLEELTTLGESLREAFRITALKTYPSREELLTNSAPFYSRLGFMKEEDSPEGYILKRTTDGMRVALTIQPNKDHIHVTVTRLE